ncbi:hypothetical protein M422DRAFT_225584 [Sphaerobolus stellatus SS14]|nr:hypothetical protein M422DRAFT_225584 [Sphaerobolus stellatus SS14]
MLPQQYSPTDYYTTQPQYVNGYSASPSQSVDPGPSTSALHSLPHSQIVSESNDAEPSSKARAAARPKRRRGDSVADDSADNSPAPGSSSANGAHKAAQKKKKANRACFHCQKAHLTCDDSRPCQRCIKRGIGDKCTEGIRKKAKYLLDEEELAALKAQQQQQKAREKSASANDSAPGPSISSSRPPEHPPNPPPISDPDPLFNLTFDPAYTFGSEGANLEYSILSAILGNPSPTDDNSRLSRNSPAHGSSSNVNGAYSQFANPEWPAPPPPSAPPGAPSPTVAPGYAHQQSPVQASAPYSAPATYRPPLPHQPYSSVSSYHASPAPITPQAQQGPSAAAHHPPLHQPQAQMHYSQPAWTEQTSGQPPMDALTASSAHGTPYARADVSSQPQNMSYHVVSTPHDSSVTPGQGMPPISPPPSNSSPGTPMVADGGFSFQTHNVPSPQRRPSAVGRPSQLFQAPHWSFNGGLTGNVDDRVNASSAIPDPNSHSVQKEQPVSSVYDAVAKPFDYTQGYHDLMRHLHEQFDKNDILRVVRALAIVRPSLIALQMPLTEEDEIFVEKCFQRSLIEMDKLISFGGTPTVVWRRTGEICLVGFEFTMLTGWTREELLGKGKYIYELFENQSTVEYYEKFAAHAFENTTQSVISHCVLLKPSGAPVPCAFCFSIKRDIFDLPNMIIGQWLPLL